MASDPVFVLPGDRIDPSLIPSHPKKPLRLGPGLRHEPPNDIVPTLAGQLVTERQKNGIRVETATGRYAPRTGELVYARVALANKHMDPELECVSSSSGKADGLGPLAGGMLFPVSLGMSRRLLLPKSVQEGKVVVLEELAAAGLQFETATGRNGQFWVDSDKAKTVIAVGRAVQETDEKRLDVEEQKKLVRKLVKELS